MIKFKDFITVYIVELWESKPLKETAKQRIKQLENEAKNYWRK